MNSSKRLRYLIVALATVNFAAVVVLKAIHEKYPAEIFWKSFPWWLPTLGFLITAGVPSLQPVLLEIGERRRRQRLEMAEDIREYLAAGLIKIVEDTGLGWKELGIHAFLVRGRWRWQEQRRVSKIKLRRVTPSGVKWTKDKGVIGRCWATSRACTIDLRNHFEPHANATKEAWAALDPATRFGLTFEDFQRTRGHYGVVSAVPIFDTQERYIGCVSMDSPSDCPKDLQVNVIEEDLMGIATLLGRYIGTRG